MPYVLAEFTWKEALAIGFVLAALSLIRALPPKGRKVLFWIVVLIVLAIVGLAVVAHLADQTP